MQIRPFQPNDREAVVGLWKSCGLVVPQNDPYKDIDRKLSFQADLLLVADEDGEIVGAVMAGYEGHRGAINYMAVHPDYQRKGLGKTIMEDAVARLRALGCAKVNLNVRTSNLGVIDFYKSLGFVQDEVVCLGLRLEFDC
jgi:ribosomal protein S18 acetylase RimI-like enzyme